MFMALITIMLIASIAVPYAIISSKGESRKRFKKALIVNIGSFLSTLAVALIMLFSGAVFAAGDTAAAATASQSGLAAGLGYIAAGIVTGIGCIGAGIAVGTAASAALGAISENEKLMGKALIFVALAEGIALYGLVISFMILSKI